MKVYPLAQAANPPATVFTDVKDVDFDSTIRYDASFFENLDRIVQSRAVDRPRPRDDRPAQVARHREGQAVQSRREPRRRCSTPPRSEAGAWLEAKYDAGLPPFFSRPAAGRSRRRRNSSRRRRRATPTRTTTRSTAAAWPTATPSSASSDWAPGSSILISIRDKDGDSLRRRQDLSPDACRRTCRSSSTGR